RMTLHLFADRQLALQVSMLLFFNFAMLTSPMFKEVITRFFEFLEDCLSKLLRYRTNLLPLRLQGLQFGRCRFPIGTILKLACASYQFILELQILLAFFIELLEECVLVGEELLESGPEALIDFLRLRAWKPTYFLPPTLQFKNLFRLLIPLFDAVRLERRERLHFIRDRHLAIEVYVQFLLQRLEVRIAARIHSIRCCLETLPYRVLVFNGHRADVFELVVEFVQFADR